MCRTLSFVSSIGTPCFLIVSLGSLVVLMSPPGLALTHWLLYIFMVFRGTNFSPFQRPTAPFPLRAPTEPVKCVLRCVLCIRTANSSFFINLHLIFLRLQFFARRCFPLTSYCSIFCLQCVSVAFFASVEAASKMIPVAQIRP